MGNRRLRKPLGQRVRLLEFDPPKEAEVEDLLSVQFTAIYLDGTDTLTYRLYADHDITWEDA
jgi:hypothetical protein